MSAPRWTTGTVGDEPALWWGEDDDDPALTVWDMPAAWGVRREDAAMAALVADVGLARRVTDPSDETVARVVAAIGTVADQEFPCSCLDAFKRVGRLDPQCAYHEVERGGGFEVIARAVLAALADTGDEPT